ncbi:NotI family restriction endonuclease [Methylotuvimicrobium buryatense]|uniref:NotI family restriction endonuclease n=1 Tax=Methylotuvimicrobium buryatense TaxID=95641 RepID=UPI000367053D|nr:NotI family restriction endonuclease [Methylotuvimicrobium buryatense]
MKPKTKKLKDLTPRFGIGEWYGHNLTQLTGEERRQIAEEVLKTKKERIPQPCPFQARKKDAICSKEGGVCSLRLYSYAKHPGTDRAMGVPVDGKQGELRATCPYRFHEELDVFNWVGETILDDPEPLLVGEVGFLEAGATTDNEGGDDVGRIDMVLVSSKTTQGAPMAWAALEIQAVYFSGNAMKGEFEAFNDASVDWVIFPAGRRRPDYRSSGPKRLMPQLQIKVPTLRRWGKKMAVVVDRAFFDSIGEMDNVTDISNADIAWFIVRFEEVDGQKRTRIVRDEIRYTTLERSVEGLTGGKPVPLSMFETRINEKIIYPVAKQLETDLFSIEGDNTGNT